MKNKNMSLSELDYLQNLVFAAITPGNSAEDFQWFSEHIIDPVLREVSQLTAELEKSMEKGVTALCQLLLTQLCPQFIRVFPAAVIVQATLNSRQCKQTQAVVKSTQLASQAIGAEQQVCRFRTQQNIIVNPLSLMESMVDRDNRTLSLVLQAFSATSLQDMELGQLRFYIKADEQTVSRVLCGLFNKRQCVNVYSQSEAGEKTLLSDAVSIKTCSLSKELSVRASTEMLGYQLLQDYFLFPQKFFFFELCGLEKINFTAQDKKIILEFSIEDADAFSAVEFMLHCVSAINLYPKTAEPIHLCLEKTEYPVFVDRNKEESLHVHHVTRVVGMDSLGETYQYHELSNTLGDESMPRYSFYRKENKQNYLGIASVLAAKKQKIACDVLVCNLNYPQQFCLENSLRVFNERQFETIAVQNVTRPSRAFLPPKTNYYYETLFQFIKKDFSTMVSTESLKQLFTLLNWDNAAYGNSLISIVETIVAKSAHQVKQGIVQQGINVEITLVHKQSQVFSEYYLFGIILHAFFVSLMPIGYFVTTTMQSQNSSQEFLWGPNNGSKTVF